MIGPHARPAALEGSLGELALPDVLQLLDLGRKAGVLHVRAAPPAGDGALVLVDGRVYGAAVREPGAAADEASREALIDGALRRPRAEVEAAAYELLEWTAGTFSFVPLDPAVEAACRGVGGGGARGSFAVESLLMESARRADEWARLAPRVPHLGVVPSLHVGGGDAGAPLALAPSAWALLAAVDGTRDLRALARALRRDPLDVARDADTLVAAGIVELHDPVTRAAPDGEPAGGVPVNEPIDVPAGGRRSSSW